jgi:cell division control protein 6
MEKVDIKDKFRNYMKTESIFSNKRALTEAFDPENLPFREKQTEKIANTLAPILKLEKPRNLFIYGKSGTGKTSVVKKVTKHLLDVAGEANKPVKIIYINCNMKKIADTEFRLVYRLCEKMDPGLSKNGISLNQMYDDLFRKIDREKMCIVIILDEIDSLINRIGTNFLYTFVRINTEHKNSVVSIVGITNDTSFLNYLDGRIQSSLSEEMLLFPPYNATQLQRILQERAKLALRPNSLEDGVISLCAALAAQEHGDARRALNLLWVAGEIAEEEGKRTISVQHVKRAEIKIDYDLYVNTVRSLPKQSQIIIASIIKSIEETKSRSPSVETGDVFARYQQICNQNGAKILSHIRVSNLIAELDTLGLIDARVISHGRYGRTREIRMSFSPVIAERIKAILSEIDIEGVA